MQLGLLKIGLEKRARKRAKERRRESNYIRKSCDIPIEMLMNAGLIKIRFSYTFLCTLLRLCFVSFRFELNAEYEWLVSTNDFLLHLPVDICVNVSIQLLALLQCMNLCVANCRKLNFIIDARKHVNTCSRMHARTHINPQLQYGSFPFFFFSLFCFLLLSFAFLIDGSLFFGNKCDTTKKGRKTVE